jgi:hypothetical protein
VSTESSNLSAGTTGTDDGNRDEKVVGDVATRESSMDNGARFSPTELPTEIRVKLRRLEKLESRYQGKLNKS